MSASMKSSESVARADTSDTSMRPQKLVLSGRLKCSVLPDAGASVAGTSSVAFVSRLRKRNVKRMRLRESAGRVTVMPSSSG